MWCLLAALILWRRSRDLLGILLFLGFLSIGFILTDPTSVYFTSETDPLWPLSRWILLVVNVFTILWVFAFPDGRFVPRWSVVLAAIWAAWSLLRIPFPEVAPGRLGAFGAIAYFALPASTVAAQVYRFVWWSDEVRRQQLKWFLYGGTILVAAWALTVPLSFFIRPLIEPGLALFAYRTATGAWLAIASIALPVTLAVAIFRLGLLDIDLIINRTLMYGAVSAVLVGAFIVLSALAHRAVEALTGQRSDLVTFAVALPVAIGFIPLRARMQGIADRFVSDRNILTVLFLDIAASTERAAALGDHAWRQLLERYRSAVRRELKRFDGREIDTAGDGFFATFEGPGRAIRCAVRVIDAVRPLGIEARAGLHIGECEVQGGRVTGISVHIGARVVALARPSEVLVSRTLRDLVAGSDIPFRERGGHVLKGVPGDWQLYAVQPNAKIPSLSSTAA